MSLTLDKQILSDITVYTKYAKYLPEKERRETWDELVTRNMEMHTAKFPKMKESIEQVYKNFVFTKKVLPSMRSLQFGGKAIELNNARIYNCAFLPIDSIHSFSETMFLLLGGTGVGYSVQNHQIEKLPETLETLEPKERINILCKLMPFVFPKVEAIHPTMGEPMQW
jgi:ribonucleoside-diphosphate reductase alpha chain